MIDERFVLHRLRATRAAAIAGAVVAMGLFCWHWYGQHQWNWELLSVGLAMVTVKLSLMLWYRFTA